MIVIDNVSKYFNGLLAVDGLSVSIPDCEIFGLVGPNGAGKTTTLRMMTGILKPDSGRILINGHDIVKQPEEAKSSFGYIPDKAFFYEKLTALEFMMFIASIYTIGKSSASTQTEKLLELFGLTKKRNDLIESFSQGMRQRLLFASALVHEPRTLLIDEPFAGLDPFGVKMLKSLIKELGQSGISVFLATHSLHIAEELCDRVGFINRGRMLSVKSREEIKETDGGLEGLFLKMES